MEVLFADANLLSDEGKTSDAIAALKTLLDKTVIAITISSNGVLARRCLSSWAFFTARTSSTTRPWLRSGRYQRLTRI